MMLGFNEIVHQQFDGLASHYRMRCIASTETFVGFQNDAVFLQVLFDVGRSYEIGVEIGQIPGAGVPERPFNIAEVLRLRNASDAAYVANLEASQSESREHAIIRLAGITKNWAAELLSGSVQAFVRLGRFRNAECADYAMKRDIGYARHNAEAAWEKKDYVGVVNAYRPVDAALTPAERRRLEYAEKHFYKKM